MTSSAGPSEMETVNSVITAYQNQLIYLQQENAQLHANNGYSDHRLHNLMLENEALQDVIEQLKRSANNSSNMISNTQIRQYESETRRLEGLLAKSQQEIQSLLAQASSNSRNTNKSSSNNNTNFEEIVRSLNQRIGHLQTREQELMAALVCLYLLTIG